MAPPAKPIRTVYTIISEVSDACGIRLLTLKDPDNWELPPARAGSHIDIHLPNGLIRTYSLCGDCRVREEYKIGVKEAVEGRGGSACVHHELKVGDAVRVSLPRCTFPAVDPGVRTLFIAGGVGVTPFLSMAHELDRVGGDYELHLYYRDAIPLQAELAGVGRSGKVILHDRALTTGASVGEALGRPNPGTRAYCCGPFPMIEEFQQATSDWDPAHVGVEYFVPPTQAPLENAFTVVLKKSGLSVEVPAGASALHAIQNTGVALESACEGGVCGACKVRWLEGEPIHRDLCLTESERAQYFMPCVGGCNSPKLVIDL